VARLRRLAVVAALLSALATCRARRLADSEQRLGVGKPPPRRTGARSATGR
jgi:hypothetical protein